jgi:hypothetical protein
VIDRRVAMVKAITSSNGHGLADTGEGDDHDPFKKARKRKIR